MTTGDDRVLEAVAFAATALLEVAGDDGVRLVRCQRRFERRLREEIERRRGPITTGDLIEAARQMSEAA